MSEPVVLDVTTNEFPNPRPASLTGWQASGGESIAFISPEEGIELTDPVGGGGGYLSTTVVRTPGVGRWFAVGVDVKPLYAYVATNWRTLARISLSGTGDQKFVSATLPVNEWSRVTVAVQQVDPAATRVQGFPWPLQTPTPGAQFRAKNVVLAFADTEEAALAAVSAPIDGSMPDTPEVRYDWTGTPDASTSTRTRFAPIPPPTPEPAGVTGAATRLAAYDVLGARRGVLPDVLEYTWTAPLGGMPTLTATYPEAGRRFDLMEGHIELAVEVYHPDTKTWLEPPGARLHVIKRSWDRTDEAPVRKYEAQGLAWLARRARVWTSEGQMDSDGKRQFLSATAGKIVGTIFTEAKARGWGPGLSRSFTDVADSAGNPWDKVITIAYDPGLDLDTVIGNLYDQGVCDVRWTGRTLDLFNADQDMAPEFSTGNAPVWYRYGDVTAAPEAATIEDLMTFARVQGEGGRTWEVDNPVALDVYGRLEAYITQGGVTDEGTAMTLADAELRKGENERLQYTREFHTAQGRPWPYVDFPLGAWVLTDTDAGRERVRVHQVSLTRDQEGVSGHLTLGTRLDDVLARLAKRTKGILGGSTVDGGSGARPNPPGDDRRVPAAVDGLVVGTSAYTDPNGNARGVATLTWTAVTHASDGTVLDGIDRYEVFGRQAVDGVPWQKMTDVQEPRANLSPLGVGEDWQFRVRAVAEPGFRTGAFSGTVTVTVAEDVEAPPLPSQPLLESRLGTVTVRWDGRTSTGTEMPPDFDYCTVWHVTSGRPEVVVGSFPSQVMTADVAYPSPPTAVSHAVRFDNIRPTLPNDSGGSGIVAWLVQTSASNGIRIQVNTWLCQITAYGPAGNLSLSVPMPRSTVAPNPAVPCDLEVRLTEAATKVEVWIDGVLANSLALSAAHTTAYSNVLTARSMGIQSTYLFTYDRIEFFIPAEVDVPTPVALGQVRAGTGEDLVVLTDLPYKEEVTVYLTAVDRSGNESEPGPIATTIVTPLVDADIIGEVINGANIVPGTIVASDKIIGNTITGALIQALAITADKIAANAITTDKIVAGAITAVKIQADAITTSALAADAITAKHTITGALIQTSGTASRGIKITTGHLSAYDASGNRTFYVNATDGGVQVSGRIQTGLGDNQVVIDDGIFRGRPGIRLDTGDTSQVQPTLQSMGVASDGFTAGALVLTGREVTVNSSGRADLVLSPGGAVKLMAAYGTYSGIGLEASSYYANLMGRYANYALVQWRYGVGSAASVAAGSYADWTIVYGSPVPTGTRRPTFTPETTGRFTTTVMSPTASGFVGRAYNVGTASGTVSMGYLALWV